MFMTDNKTEYFLANFSPMSIALLKYYTSSVIGEEDN